VRGIASLVVAAAVAMPSIARAEEPTTCASFAEDGQRARMAGKLRAARDLFLKCSAESCRPFIRKDCAQWASDVDAAIPTIVIDAKDGRDDVADVTVKMDDETIATRLDGKAMPVDPGPHKLTFSRPGRVAVVQQIIVKEGQRARVLEVRFIADAPPAQPSSDTDSRPSPPPPPAERIREHGVAPWIVVAIGGAIVTTGIVSLLVRPGVPFNCDVDTGQCDYRENFDAASQKTLEPKPVTSGNANPAQREQLAKDQEKAQSAETLKLIGVVSIVTGSAIIAGGLLWHFVEPTGPEPRATIAPWTTKNGAGAAATVRF
jgi:hypothetical protein